MKFLASFSVPVNKESSAEEFRTLSTYHTTIDHYSFSQDLNCTMRGYTDDEDADLILKNVTGITCYFHNEIVAEIVVSDKLIIKVDHDVDTEKDTVRFHFYIHEKHLRFGKLLFLLPEDILN